jgi:hypothetical protein
MAAFTYTAQARELQKRFDTEALAAAELQVIVHEALSPADRGFIEQAEMFWLASVDLQGSPTVSFKGDAPGFVRMPDDSLWPGAQPIAGWKRIDAIQGLLPPRDQSKANTVGGEISMDEWTEMVKQGNPLA